jgi:hypothetical protein
MATWRDINIHWQTREGNVASSHRLRAMKNLCSRLSLLSSPHNLHSTCINLLLSLIVKVDFILNSCLWICLSPIPKLQHAFLFLKCCKLRNVPWLLFFCCCYILGPKFGFFKEFGGVLENKNPLLIFEFQDMSNDIFGDQFRTSLLLALLSQRFKILCNFNFNVIPI